MSCLLYQYTERVSKPKPSPFFLMVLILITAFTEASEVEAAAVPRQLQDVDFAVINGNYAIEAGFHVKNAVAVESKEASSPSANREYGDTSMPPPIWRELGSYRHSRL